MDYATLRIKPKTELPCNFDEESEKTGSVNCVDLLAASLNGDIAIKYTYDVIVVNQYYVARPDLISLAVYGTDDYADILCKINGISNPFELNEDMLIYCPSLYDIEQIYENSLGGPCELIEKGSTVKKKVSKYQKRKDELRSPSMQTIGDNNYVIDKSSNLVFY